MLRAVMDQIRLTWRLLRDPRVPMITKLIPFLGLVYVVSPIDIIPDLIIGLGQLDDLGIILAGMRLFEALVPEHIALEHRTVMAGKPVDVIDAPAYRITRVEDEKPKNG